MNAWRLFLFLLTCFAAPAAAGAITATRIDGSGQSDWTVVRIAFVPQGQETEVLLQDPRGGPAMVCVVVPGTDATLIPMPLVAPEQLKGASWPLGVTLRARGRDIAQAMVNLPVETEATYRVAVPAGTPQEALRAVDWQTFTDRPVAFIEWPAIDADTPPLLFAGSDAVMVTDETAVTGAQARAMAALGTRLVHAGTTATPPAAPAGWVWEHAGKTAEKTQAWTTPAVVFRRPSVIEPGLADLPAEADPPPGGITRTALWVGPAAVMAVLLARGLLRGTRHAFAGAILGITVVAAGGVACLHVSNTTAAKESTLREIAARADVAAGAAVVTEVLGRRSSFLGRGGEAVTAKDGCLYPIAATPQAYFALSGWELVLRGKTTELRGPLAHGQILHYLVRSAEPAGAMPAMGDSAEASAALAAALHGNAGDGQWISGGYVFSHSAGLAQGAEGTLFTTWEKGQDRTAADAARAWEALRFDATHQYFMWKDAGGLNWIDYGAAP